MEYKDAVVMLLNSIDTKTRNEDGEVPVNVEALREVLSNVYVDENTQPVPADRMLERRRVVTGSDWVELIEEMKPINLTVEDICMSILAYREDVEPYSVTEPPGAFYRRMLDHLNGEREHRVVIVDGMLSRHEVPREVNDTATLVLGIRADGRVVVAKDRYGLFPNGFDSNVLRAKPLARPPLKGTGKRDEDYRAAEPLREVRRTARMLSRARKANATLSNIYAAAIEGTYEPSEEYNDLVYELHREAGRTLLEANGGILMGYLTGFEQMEDERNQFIAAFTFAFNRGFFAPHHMKALAERYSVLVEYAPEMGLQS